MLRNIIQIILLAATLSGCGANMLSVAEPADPGQDAIRAMEKNKPEEAITILEDALEGDPSNVLFLSLLSSAIAQKHGFDPLNFAFNLAEQQGSETASGDGITSMFGALPPATDETIAGIQLAISTLESIAIADRSEEDSFKLSLLHTANMSLLTKQVGSLIDGEFDVADLQNMTDEQAVNILSSLLNASDTLLEAGADGENTAKTKAEIDSIKAAIAADEADTDAEKAEKLRSYFETQNTEAAE